MEKINSVTGLKSAIYELEDELNANKTVMFQQFDITLESLKPINLLKNTLKEVSSTPFLIENIAGAAIGIASGYLTKKIVVGKSLNLFRKFFGSVIQFGITNVITNHPGAFRIIGQFLFRKKDHAKIQ